MNTEEIIKFVSSICKNCNKNCNQPFITRGGKVTNDVCVYYQCKNCKEITCEYCDNVMKYIKRY